MTAAQSTLAIWALLVVAAASLSTTPSGVQLRRCGPADRASIVALSQAEFGPDDAVLRWLLNWGYRERLARPDDDTVVFGAFETTVETETLVGFAELSLQPLEVLPPPIPLPRGLKRWLACAPYVTNVLVAPASRRRGHAAALVAACEARAAAWAEETPAPGGEGADDAAGRRLVTLHLDPADEPARALYERLGYGPVTLATRNGGSNPIVRIFFAVLCLGLPPLRCVHIGLRHLCLSYRDRADSTYRLHDEMQCWHGAIANTAPRKHGSPSIAPTAAPHPSPPRLRSCLRYMEKELRPSTLAAPPPSYTSRTRQETAVFPPTQDGVGQ